MVIKLSLDSSAFGSGLDAAKKASKNAMMEMKTDMAIAAAAGDKVGVLQAKQAGLMKEMASKVNEMKRAQDAYNASFTKTGQAQASTAKYAKDFNKAAMELARFQKQIVQAAGQQAVLEVKTKGVTGAINKMGAGLTTGGKALSSFGSKATMGVTVPIVAAFAAATKKAMAFQNQLIVIKNLLTTSGESGASAMKAVNQMQEQAVQLSNHYGVSVEKITEGYEALVRRGYNGAQAVGAMKAELQGALASGDDFNDVVKVASETIESFGLRVDKSGHQIQSTSKMAAITKKTVNELAYAADMTATDFQGMGYSMSYVGATAKQAGYSVSSTAAALGILSNNGLSSQKAGTGLRKVLISLT
ncbi:MAG: phage tail tape measure protein, partial [Lactobacillus sp.]|nr:phage tail tape measure protein [Lactobacillus sp.]